MEKKDKIGIILSKKTEQIPEGLADRITVSINSRIRLAAKIRAYVFGLTSLGAAVLFFFTGRMALADLYNSGTSQVFSLVFSDFQSVISNFGNFVLTIAESIPVLSVVYAVLSAVILFVMAAIAISNIRKVESIKLNYFNKNGYKHA